MSKTDLPSPRISVVIPAYNRAETICTTLDSLLAQTLAAHEIIVVDDCSETEVSSVLRGHYPTVKVIRHKVNLGVQMARNTGFMDVSGDYVLFLDSDDILFPEFLSVAVKLLQKDKTLGACFGNFHRCFDENIVPITESHVQKETESRYFPQNEGLSFYLENTGAFLPSFTLFRKTALDNVCMEGQLFPQEVWGNEDFHLFVRTLSKYPVLFIENTVGIYLLQPESISRNQIKVWSSRTIAIVSLLNIAKSPPFSASNIKTLRKMRGSSVRRNARLLYTGGDSREATSRLLKEFQRSPNAKTLGLLLIVMLNIKMRKKQFAGREY